MVDILITIVVLAIAKIAGSEAGNSKARLRKAREINDMK